MHYVPGVVHGKPMITVGVAEVVARLRAAGCVFAEEEAALLLAEAADDADLHRRLTRRVDGEPLEQVLGWAAFAGLRVAVAPGVFVPRRRSELLVSEALAHLTARGPRGGQVTVVDLCCGTAAIGLAVASALVVAGGRVQVHAADVDPAATACAARNLAALPGRSAATAVHTGDLFGALPAELRGHVDVLLVNAPYVPSGEVALMPHEARDHEPRAALDGGDDGLDLHRRVAAGARRWLAPGGALLLETSRRQAEGTAGACRRGGLRPAVVHNPDLGATAVVALA